MQEILKRFIRFTCMLFKGTGTVESLPSSVG